MFDHHGAPADAGGPASGGSDAPEDVLWPSLGSSAKSVDRRRVQKRRQRVAAALLPDERVSSCLWSMAARATGVTVLLREKRARFNGLQTCGSVWVCPVCSQRIAEVRRKELNAALVWARGSGFVPVMLTLTARHGLGDCLQRLLSRLKDAKRALRQSRSWRALKSVLRGTITASEVTHGRAGFHPHFHELLFVQAESETEAVLLIETLRAEWVRCLERFELNGNGHAFRVQGAAEAGRYIAKFGAAEQVHLADCAKPGGSWGAAEELTLSARKSGQGLHPFELLDRAAKGDRRSRAAFVEYAAAFRGRRQLVWSPGLKGSVALEDVSDDMIAKGSEDQLDVIVGIVEPDLWWRARYLKDGRSLILEAAENHRLADFLDFLRRMLGSGLEGPSSVPGPMEDNA